MAIAALIVAIVAALIALASAAYTRRQAVASEAAAAIEGKRLHDDLTPQMAVTCTERPGTRWADMTVELTGPAGLAGLDEVTIRIRDDIPDRKPRPGSDLAQEQISEVIWGPTGSTRGYGTPTRTAGHTGRSGCPSTSRIPCSSSRPRHHPGPPPVSGVTSTKASLCGLR
jgi:hypothetical protein